MSNTIMNEEALTTEYPGVLEIIRSCQIGTLKQLRSGSYLFQQGDPSQLVFAVKRGAVKVYSVSKGGRVHTFTVHGPGRLVGMDVFLTGGQHTSTSEAVCSTEVYAIGRVEFERLVNTNSDFSRALMREMAQATRDLVSSIQDLVFLDVLQRLKYVLMGLAKQHGHATARGIRIDLDLTHEEIAALVAADRSTITIYLNELVRQGYLWREGRCFVILPLQHIEIIDSLSQSVVEGDEARAMSLAREVVELGVDPLKALGMMTNAMKQVDKGLVRGDLALSDVMLAVYATKCALPIIEQELRRTGKGVKTLGRVIIGTVHGDIHDMGKTMVSTMLTVAGFEVIDLGVDVTAENFVEAIENHRPDILAMSAFLTTTASEPEQVIGILKERGLRDQVGIIVGGGAMTPELTQHAGGDGYERTADGAVGLAKRLVDAE